MSKNEQLKEVNSQTYWDTRFSMDWESNFGREQSRYFSRLALKFFPAWLMRTIKANSLTFCDWGCAQGDGTDVLAEAFAETEVTGVDFSSEAIVRATSTYPRCRFLCDDFLTSTSDLQFDVVFSSNTLEHFHEPWQVLKKISAKASNFLVLLIPFREYERINEHFVTFDFTNIPIGFGEWSLMHSEVIEAAAVEPSYWSGQQILLIYGKVGIQDKLGLTLSEIMLHTPDTIQAVDKLTTLVRTECEELRSALSASQSQLEALELERDRISAERDRISAERDQAHVTLANMIDSHSWQLTKPLRFLRRMTRHGLVEGDRQKLYNSTRSILGRLPSPARKLLRRSYDALLRRPVRTMRSSFTSSLHFDPPVIKPIQQQDGTFDYIIWGVIDWHFRYQRPQQIARALAGTGRRVFYISSNFVDEERIGFDVEQLDQEGRLFQIKLYVRRAPVIYAGTPDASTVANLRASVGELLEWADCRLIISLIQHPFWTQAATMLPNSRTVYDCMDHHDGFDNTSPEISALERILFQRADLTVTTSDWLDKMVAAEKVECRALIRNGGDYLHFSRTPATIYRDAQGRQIIGYYGAIAEWFDLALVEGVAKRFSDCEVLLVGADTIGAQGKLRHLRNVKFVGEVPYAELPHYLYAFDVCLLPFLVTPLTLATNPVKVYEYLSAGKAVVSVDLPELKQFDGLVTVAQDAEGFVTAVGKALADPENEDDVRARQQFAQEQTWMHRVQVLVEHVETKLIDPLVSVIVVTYNNINLTRACLSSLDDYSDYGTVEIIVVDNASSDGSPEFLKEWAAGAKNRALILNADNKGFAAANNQGLAIAKGSYLVLLNNDTVVTAGWIRTMVQRMEADKSIGLLGPVTNNIGNEAKIDIAYSSPEEMPHHAAAYTRRHIGRQFDLRTAAFFCVMIARDVYEQVGPLDEAFGRGFFEDDDYCRRVEQIGRRIVCAEDVFIHHHLSASFNKLRSQDRQALFEANKKVYEAKWGTWTRHEYRGDSKRNISDMRDETLPRDCK